MARTTAPAAPATETPAAVEDKPAATFDWDALSEPSVVEYTYAESKSAVDWEKVTPEPLKARVKASYAAYEAAYVEAEKAARQSTGIPSPGVLPDSSVKRMTDRASKAAARKQACSSQAQLEEFVKICRGYAASLGYTFRSGGIADGQTEIVYRVKPKEIRTRS